MKLENKDPRQQTPEWPCWGWQRACWGTDCSVSWCGQWSHRCSLKWAKGPAPWEMLGLSLVLETLNDVFKKRSGKSPGEGNATHSSILAWETSWTEEPGGLQSMELQRVGRDLGTKSLLPFEHRIPHKNLVVSQSAHGFCTWRTESSLIPSGRVHQQWEAAVALAGAPGMRNGMEFF